MGIIIRQGIKNSVVTYLGVFIGTINVLFLYNKFLTSEQLGLYTVLLSYPFIFSALIHLGTPHVATKFFSVFKNEEKNDNSFFSYLILVPMFGLVVFVLAYSFLWNYFNQLYGVNSPLLVQYYWAIPLITFCFIYQLVLDSYCKVHLRIVVPAFIREIIIKISNSILALLYGFGYIDFDQLIWGIILFSVLAVILLLIYIHWLGEVRWGLNFLFFKKPYFKEMVKFGTWSILGGVTASAMPHIEKIMLPAYNGGLENTAIFNIALSIGLVITIPRNALGSISEPLLASAWYSKDLDVISNIYRKSAINLLIAGLFLFLSIWTNIDSIFQLIPNSEIYQKGKLVVFIVGLYSLVDMSTGLNSEILKNSPYFKYDFTLYILRFIVLVGVNLLLIPQYGYNGAAFSMLISLIVYNLFKFIFIKVKLKIQPFNIKFLIVISLGVFTYFLTLLIPQFSNTLFGSLLTIIIKSAIIVIVFGGGVLYLNLSSDLNQLAEQVIKIFRKKF